MPKIHPKNKFGFADKFKYCPHHDIDSLSSPNSFMHKSKTIRKKAHLECKLCNYEYVKKWETNNPERYKKMKMKWRLDNKEMVSANQRKWQKNRLLNNPNFKLVRNLRRRIWSVLKNNTKSDTTMSLLGCSIEEFKKYIEKKFEDGMDWNNYGVWHIDHIIPCAQFDLSDPEQQKICFHYTNLQPMWGENNMKKGSRLI